MNLAGPEANKTLVHYNQLDGLRAFAVFFVFIEHFLPKNYRYLLDTFRFGNMGVTLFFVLSGFLIGGILLKQRDSYDTINWAKIKFILRQFYVRRSLRIFPIYYILITVLLIIGYPSGIKDAIIWCYGYVFNLYMAINNTNLYPLLVIWTLCCEEQFYLILPLIILICPKKHQLTSIVIMIAVGMLFRTSLYLLKFTQIQYSVLVFSSFDMFGLGVLLAYLIKTKQLYRINALWCLVPLLIYFYLGSNFLNFPGKSFLYVLLPFFGLTSFIIIASAASNGLGYFGKICELKPIAYLGKISYGMYLYHTFCFYLLSFISENWMVTTKLSENFLIILGLILTLIISSLSYHLIETPINNLKKRFNY